ncbi:MAG: cation transporter [Proteobacteria bacterium]|nr:cation transporter [Pseudomonadota bacterium]
MSEKIVFKVKGMSCGHCEMAVKKALTSVAGVSKAAADHKAGQAEVEIETDQADVGALIEAIKKAGYEAEAA